MRFEVNVDDGNNLNTLHKAREAYNAANPQAAAEDMPSYVQCLMDRAVAGALEPIGPNTLSDALAQIARLQAQNADLAKDVAALTPASAAPATPA